MPQFRLTQKVATACKLKELQEPKNFTHLLDDWFMDVVQISRHKVVMFVHGQSLFTFLVPYGSLKSVITAPAYLHNILRDFLKGLGLSDRQSQLEKVFEGPVIFCKTKDPRVLGHMNDFKRALRFYLPNVGDAKDMEKLGYVQESINETPMDYGVKDYDNPGRRFLKLLEGR
jgi:hypothetical protein